MAFRKLELLVTGTLLFLVMFFMQCNDSAQVKSMSNAVLYFKNFDIFKLKAIDTIANPEKNNGVEVRYKNGMPLSIKYYKSDRTVSLSLEDTFIVRNKLIYVYTTSNFHGGMPGENRVYGTHSEEYKDQIYVSLSDTLICKSYQLPSKKNFDYALYMYIKDNNDSIVKYQGAGNSKSEFNLRKEVVYLNWITSLADNYKNNKDHAILIKRLPE